MKKRMKRNPGFLFCLALALICMGACSPEGEAKKPAESVAETDLEAAGRPKEKEDADRAGTETSVQDETAPEAGSGEVELLSVMTDSRYDNIWEEDRQLSSVNYRMIWLDDRETHGGAQSFPKLAQALNDLNDQTERNARQSLEDLGDQARDMAQEGYFDELSYQSDAWVIRADSQILSLLTWDYVYMGGAHGDYGYTGISFDPQSGRKLELKDVVTDPDRLAQLAADRLAEKYSEVEFFEPPADVLKRQTEDGSLAWVAGYEGITLYFGPYELAPYSYGIQSVTILYKESPELFDPKICRVPGSWAVRLAPGMEFDLGQDGTLDTVEAGGVPGEYGDGSAYEQFRVCVNGEESRRELWFYQEVSYLVHSDDLDTELLVSETTSDNDFQVTLVYELDPEKEGFRTPWDFPGLGFFAFYEEKEDDTYRYGTEILTDPDHFRMRLHMDLLSTYFGSRWYGFSEEAKAEGYLKPEQPWYDVDRKDWYLTLLIPLEMETGDQGDTRIFPAGTKLWIVRVEGNEVGFVTEDGTDCRVSVDPSEWPGRVGDTDASEIFDGMMFAG